MKVSFVIRKFKFLKSMGFGIMLLVMILIMSVIGTVIPQGESQQYYTTSYSDYIGELIRIFELDHVFTSYLFAVIFGVLAINLLLCSTIRLGNIIRNIKKRFNIDLMKEISTYKLVDAHDFTLAMNNIFRGYGAAGLLKYKCKDGIYYSSKNLMGYLGSWFIHLGIMLIILFYIYGQVTFYTEDIIGVPGDIVKLSGTDYFTVIKDFDVSYREDGSVKQYFSTLQLQDGAGKQLGQGRMNVNNPMRYKGYSFYQTGTGWAAECRIYNDEIPLKREIIYEKAALSVPEQNITVALTKFYPDFSADEKGFSTLSDQPNNPALLYAFYYRNELVKMDIVQPGEPIRWNEFSFNIDNFKRYTYIKVNKMRGQIGAAFGGLLIVLGLMLNFYFKPRELAIRKQDDMLHIYGKTKDLSINGNWSNVINIDNLINTKEEGIDV